MKKSFISLVLSLSYCFSNGQVSGSGTGQPFTQSRMTVYQTLGDVEEKRDFQKMFMDQEWMPGIASFKSGRPNVVAPMIFDIYNGVPYYLQSNMIMEFVDSVSEFTMSVPDKHDTIEVKFRRMYPAVEKNTSSTFYRVLVDGKFQLLRCEEKSVLLIKDDHISPAKKKEARKVYFACLPGREMQLISLDEDHILSKMKEYANIIHTVLNKDKIKIKNEAKLVELFIGLNNYSE